VYAASHTSGTVAVWGATRLNSARGGHSLRYGAASERQRRRHGVGACMSSVVIGYEETGQSGGVLANGEQTNNAAPTTMAVDLVENENATEVP
jgi:hypothetical protein